MLFITFDKSWRSQCLLRVSSSVPEQRPPGAEPQQPVETNGQAAARLRSPYDEVLELRLAGVAVVETGHHAHITIVHVVRQVQLVNQLPIDEKAGRSPAMATGNRWFLSRKFAAGT